MTPNTFYRAHKRAAAYARAYEKDLSGLKSRKAIRAHFSTKGCSPVLDRWNEKLADIFGVTLHPTKGYRRVNFKRTQADRFVALLRNGAPGFHNQTMKAAFK